MATSDLTTFGELVHHFRKRAHLTQQTLAAMVGVNFYTISKWERGVYLPESKTMVLEVARQLRLTEPETRQFLEASLTALSPSWLVPAPRNPFFTGRMAMLERLHQRLQQEQAVAVSQSYALSGLGGIGKTQLALEYAYQHAQDYHAVFWVAAETPETLTSSFLSLAELLHLPERAAKEQQQVVSAVLRWLSSHKGWLLIYDNVEDVRTLKPFLPAARQGAVLLTTRLQALEGVAPKLDLSPFSVVEGVQFLLVRAGLLEERAPLEEVPRATQEAAQALVEALGGLPLALDQAGAYIERHGCALADYLRLYQQRELALLSERSLAAEHPQSVVTTFALSFEQVAASSPAAAELLEACAFLAPEAIPEDLFTGGAAQLGPALSAVADDADLFNRVVGDALRYSLLQRNDAQHTLSLHRLVQAVLRAQVEETRQRVWTERVVRLVAAAFPDQKDSATWAKCQQLLPHTLACAGHIERWGFSFPEASHLLNQAGNYLWRSGQYVAAAPLVQRALALREQALGPDHPDVAQSLNVLAILYERQGQYAQALPLQKRVLSILEQAFGPDHPLVAFSLNNLALIYYDQGQYAAALPLYQRALLIREQALGLDHPLVALSLNNLAALYYDQGQYAAALPLHQRALAIREQVLGPDHPDVAESLTNLAELHQAQEQYALALPLLQRALAIQEKALEPDHPNVAYSLNILAMLYHAQGQGQAALPLARRALAIREQMLGTNHPDMANSLMTLASLARGQGQYAEAEPLFQRALAIREQALGAYHPDTAASLHEIAALRAAQGQSQEAAALYQRALAIREQVYGSAHPATSDTRQRLQAVWYTLGTGEAAPPEQTQTEAKGADERRRVGVWNGQIGPQEQRRSPRALQPRPVTFICAWCQASVTELRAPGPTPRYCSAPCATAAAAAQNRTRVRRHRARQRQASETTGGAAAPKPAAGAGEGQDGPAGRQEGEYVPVQRGEPLL